jgi:hypothetical protein
MFALLCVEKKTTRSSGISNKFNCYVSVNQIALKFD